MFYKDRYAQWTRSFTEINAICPGAIEIQNDYFSGLDVEVAHHFNAVLLQLRTKHHGCIGGSIKVDSKLGHIIRFLDDLLEPREGNKVAQKVHLNDFANTPIRVVICRGEVIAIGHFIDDCFVLVAPDVDNSLWAVNK